MNAVCFVAAADYRALWQGLAREVVIVAPAWSGIERRVGFSDRRHRCRDRRWDSARGRRMRLADRRRS